MAGGETFGAAGEGRAGGVQSSAFSYHFYHGEWCGDMETSKLFHCFGSFQIPVLRVNRDGSD